jgi:pimeloyl-ACP methyl ester carboxylesterase
VVGDCHDREVPTSRASGQLCGPGAKPHYDGIVAFSQTDFTEDLKKITVPVLVMHSEDDQIVPYVVAGEIQLLDMFLGKHSIPLRMPAIFLESRS